MRIDELALCVQIYTRADNLVGAELAHKNYDLHIKYLSCHIYIRVTKKYYCILFSTTDLFGLTS